MPTPETLLKKDVKEYLALKNYFWWYTLQGIGAYKGVPDIFVLYKGVLYGIEVKGTRGKLSEHQKYFHNQMTQNGAVPIVAWTLEDVMNYL